MSKRSMKARQLAEEQLDLLLQEHCEEVASETTPPTLSNLATRLQMSVDTRSRTEEKPSQIRLDPNSWDKQSWQDYDLSVWDAPVYHS